MLEGGWEEILIAAHAGEPPFLLRRARAIAAIGLEGDRYFTGSAPGPTLRSRAARTSP